MCVLLLSTRVLSKLKLATSLLLPKMNSSESHAESDLIDVGEILSEISVPNIDMDALGVSPNSRTPQSKDIFAEEKRKAWDKSVEAMCDFTYRLRLTRRSNVNFVSIWQKSLYGRTLTEIKADDDMVQFFADSIVPVIKEMLGYNLPNGDWAVVTTPKRRHLTKNFATRISEVIAQQLGIPFYEDVASCRSKQRMNAVFTLNVLPKEANLIVFDDFVTTGQTLASMRRLLEEHGKNLVFFTGINNKL